MLIRMYIYICIITTIVHYKFTYSHVYIINAFVIHNSTENHWQSHVHTCCILYNGRLCCVYLTYRVCVYFYIYIYMIIHVTLQIHIYWLTTCVYIYIYTYIYIYILGILIMMHIVMITILNYFRNTHCLLYKTYTICSCHMIISWV